MTFYPPFAGRHLLLALTCVFSLFACTSESDSGISTSSSDSTTSTDESDIYYSELTDTDDWTEATHEKLSTDEIIENLDVVFDTGSVQKLRIVIESDNWTLMNEDLEALTDELGGSNDFSELDNPIFVPANVFYYSEQEDTWTEWYKVGVRFKGNSSLYNANSSKLPFKLDFDEFEDEYPAIDNQRFYGFKQLNLKNNYNDESEMHEISANDLFRDFGLVSAHSSFYVLYLNVDDSDDEANDIYYGVYTLVEEVDDTVIETQYYDNDDGNLYKPDGDAATFASGTYDEDEFDLKTDDDESYEDIEALYTAINDSSRTSDVDSWKEDLESIFDVDTFLKWLAANSVMQNWDTYGVMSHNFFLYNNPTTGTFQWIPWDNNEALVDDEKVLSLNMNSVDADEWPLIGYILAQDDYTNTYQAYVEEFAKAYMNASSSTSYNLNDEFTTYQTLIEDYVEAEGSDYTFTSESEFEDAVDTLQTHTLDRYDSASNYVGF